MEIICTPEPHEFLTRQSRYAQKTRADDLTTRLKNVAILDMETDPFDAETNRSVYPFLAVLYLGPKVEPTVIWDEDHTRLCEKIYTAIASLPERYTIYAHNGGRFDYYFLLSRLRGGCQFKGRAIMSAKIGHHDIRDSFHLIPERLSNLQKDDFDYTKMLKSKRRHFREEIIRYCINDCRFLYRYLIEFLQEFGMALSIGQVAWKELRKHYDIEKLGPQTDKFLRQYFYGGRVECFRGRGHWHGDFRLYDVNSMYPAVMAGYEHPICAEFRVRSDNTIRPSTCFLTLTCDSKGAFLLRKEDGSIEAPYGRHTFNTTIHEYHTAIRLGLCRNAVIHRTVDFPVRTDFSLFVNPNYARRELDKKWLKENKHLDGTEEYFEHHKNSIFGKLKLNNGYGKSAQDPSKFKEVYISEPECAYPSEFEVPKEPSPYSWGIYDPFHSKSGFSPNEKYSDYWVWTRKASHSAHSYNNVACGASITGAARATLLEAKHKARNPHYCDTDSIICEELEGVELDPSKLGAWDLEASFDELAIAGKKQYAFRKSGMPDTEENRRKGFVKVRQKGANNVVFDDIVNLVYGKEIERFASKAPLIHRDGSQTYQTRLLRATAPILKA